ncbi:glycosidase, partial [Rhodopirellula bahusiensis]
MDNSLFVRYCGNPILTADDWPYSCNTVFNPAAVRLKDGRTLLLCRVEDHRGMSHLCAARSTDGLTNWIIDLTPTMQPDIENHPEEIWGVEDSRITFVPELDRYAVAYTSFSGSGPGVSLALTDDFRSFERFGTVMPPEDKDAALLPRRIGDYRAMIHRPVGSIGAGGAHIWISYSPDLRHWGSHKMILEARKGAWWDADRIGLSPPLIETSEGWLMLYHGVRSTVAGKVYRVGLALFDLEQPERCLRRGDPWLFASETDYERGGDVENVVFPCGTTVADDGDTLHMYYGAADTCVPSPHSDLKTSRVA